MGRPKNPRTLLIERTRYLKTAAEAITRPMTLYAARTVYITREEREASGTNDWHRPRRPEEHVDRRPGVWLAARRDLVEMAGIVREADVLIRYKLADLGHDARGIHIGRYNALARLDPTDVATLITLGVWDGSLPEEA